MPVLIAIDPGTKESGAVCFDGRTLRPGMFPCAIYQNADLLETLRTWSRIGPLVIESVESFGQRVSFTIFETVRWAGRFQEAWESRGGQVILVPRREVKMHLCGIMKAKDADIRQALLYKFGDGSRDMAMGTKANPGPLYGVTNHLMAALAVAVTWTEKNPKGDDEDGTAKEGPDAAGQGQGTLGW